MNRSRAALLIAILFHLVLILFFWLLTLLMAEYKPQEEEEKEHRIKVSLKEQPKAAKEAPVKNKAQTPAVAPPMPKGRQLKELVKEFETYTPPKEPKPVEPNRQTINEPSPQSKPPKAVEVPKTKPLPQKESHIPLPEKAPEKADTPKEHAKLYSLLSKQTTIHKSTEGEKHSKKRDSLISQNLKELYGEEFGKLTEGEQKYLMDNQEIMRRITQGVLNRIARVNIPRDLRVNDQNIIEFYLHPNGDISDLHFIKRSKFYLLDDTTKETIEYAYSKYPRPQQKTLVRYRVGYYLSGY